MDNLLIIPSGYLPAQNRPPTGSPVKQLHSGCVPHTEPRGVGRGIARVARSLVSGVVQAISLRPERKRSGSGLSLLGCCRALDIKPHTEGFTLRRF